MQLCIYLQRINEILLSCYEPAKIGGLTRLEELHIDHNQLSSLPGAIWGLPQLKMLEIECNPLRFKDQITSLYTRFCWLINRRR